MNKYGTNDSMRNVYQEAAETRAKTYLNKHQRIYGNPEQNSEEGEKEQGQSQSATQPKKRKERYITRK